MTQSEMQQAFREFMNWQRASQNKPHKLKMEFSKKLIIGAFIFYGLIGVVSIVAWFALGEWPREVAEFFVWPIVGLASYMFKTAYENRAKIENSREDTI